jgi:hypothetical protein
VILESAGPLLQLISELVSRGRSCGELSAADDPERFRSALISLGLGYTLQYWVMVLARERSGDQRSDDQFVDYVSRMLLPHLAGLNCRRA